MDKDLGSTLAGGGAGLGLLMTVKWETIPHGELYKLAMVVFLIAAGAILYRKKGAA